MKRIIYVVLVILISSTALAKSKKVAPEIEPYASGSYGKFKFDNSYQGKYSAVGIGARVGLLLGPLFLGGDLHGQLPAFAKKSGTTVAQTDIHPVPASKTWLSYGVVGGIRTRFFSLMYSYMLDSELQAKARSTIVSANDSDGEKNVDYTYHGIGQKLSALIHFTRNFSIGAEYARYTFNKYSLGEDTHALDQGSKQGRDALRLEGYSILINYKINVEVK